MSPENDAAAGLTVTTAAGMRRLEGRTLVVWLDETGHEKFADPSFPIFGMGGCATLACDYEVELAAPWRTLKKNVFAGEDAPLHASALRSPTTDQMEKLGEFFAQGAFARLAALTSKSVACPDDLTAMRLLASYLRPWIEELANGVFAPISSLVLVFEECEILAREILSNFQHWKLRQHGIETPIKMFRATKTIAEPGLEVADFIMHTVGAQVRRDVWPSTRRDFKAIFEPPLLGEKWVKFRQILSVELNESTPVAQSQSNC